MLCICRTGLSSRISGSRILLDTVNNKLTQSLSCGRRRLERSSGPGLGGQCLVVVRE